MADLGAFNASEVDPNVDFEPLPEGKYECVITESEKKPNSKGTGHFLRLVFTVASGPFMGRNLFDNLNLDNPSEMAVKIARGTLSQICRCVGVLTPRDSSELHSLPLIVRVVQEPYEDRITNKIKGYSKKEGPELSQAKPAAATSQAPAKAASSAPWGKK